MATSGTVSQTSFDVRKIVDAAFKRCKIPAQAITAEMLEDAQNELYLFLSALPVRIVPLWAQDEQLVALPYGQIGITLPVGTIDVMKGTERLRTMTRVTGTATSSAGGTAANAIDEDLDSSCVQTSSDGTLTLDLGETKAITTVGIAMTSAQTATIVVETSTDGSTWTQRLAPGSYAYEAKLLKWMDLDPIVDARYIRMRGTGGQTLSIAEFFVGTSPVETPLPRINQQQYAQLPDKTTPGRPLQYFLDRQYARPVMKLWKPADSTSKWHLVALTRQRHIMDVGTMLSDLEVPQRWLHAIRENLALKIARGQPSVEPAVIGDIAAEAAQALALAAQDERDQAPGRVNLDISAYTR